MNPPDSSTISSLIRYLKWRADRKDATAETGFVPDWSTLQPGQAVQVFRDAELLTAGTVDATMHDGSAVWLIQHKGHGRRLFHECEEVRIRPVEPSRPSRSVI